MKTPCRIMLFTVCVLAVATISCATASHIPLDTPASVLTHLLRDTNADVSRVCSRIEKVNRELAHLAPQGSFFAVPDLCRPSDLPFYCSPSVCTCISDDFDDSLDLAIEGKCVYDSWNCDDDFRCTCRLEGCAPPDLEL